MDLNYLNHESLKIKSFQFLGKILDSFDRIFENF